MNTLANNWAPFPGEFILEELEARGWIQRDLAYILGCTDQTVNMIISGKRGIAPEMAKALGKAFNVSAELFSNLQNSYDLANAREPDPSISKRAHIQSQYPVREMIKRGWLEETDASMLEVQMARFFEVSKADEVPYLAHAAKKTFYEENEIPPSQLAWLFRVKQIAKSFSVPKYSEKALRDALIKLKELLIEPEEIRHVPRILTDAGVRFVIVEALPQSKIDGVCFWLDKNSPVIGMSLRYDRIDNFWFVLIHEIEHVLRKHGVENAIIDSELEGSKAGNDSSLPEEERIANQASANFCVPADKINSFINRKKPFLYEKDVIAFARLNNIHPGIVVGQIQFRLNRYDYLKKYQIKVRSSLLHSSMIDGWGQVAPVTI